MESTDVVIITAAEGEDTALLEVTDGALSPWTEVPSPEGYASEVHRAAFESLATPGRPIHVVTTRPPRMRGDLAANAAGLLVGVFKPSCLAMCGVCAGRPGWTQLGDVVIGERVWRYDAGGRVNAVPGGRPVLEKDTELFQLSAEWLRAAQNAAREWKAWPGRDTTWLRARPQPRELQALWLMKELAEGRDPTKHPEVTRLCASWEDVVERLMTDGLVEHGELTEAGRKHLRRELFKHKGGLPEQATWAVHVGPMGTGNDLVEDVDIWEQLGLEQRLVVGFEMELAAIGASAWASGLPFLAVKGVMDFGLPDRHRGFRPFAARASAEVLVRLLRTLVVPSPKRVAKGDSSRLPDEASPNSVADRLEDAYARREALVVAGRPTADVDAEILELRRALRRGPTLHDGEFLGDGRFRLLEVIGRGGFGLVWKAYDTKERRLVAVKVLHGELAREASRRERLFRGAKRMAELRHPNVVRVLQSEGEEEGFHYFVMELVGGGDLHRAVVEREIDVERALTVIETIADALAAAHACGLVHRDVKPENILLREDGSPALSDFDLVQAKDTTGGTRTTAMGSVIYAAPEQTIDASRVDHRADVYGLGMTAVFCVHGNKVPMTAMFNRDAFLRGLECAPEVRAVLQRAVALEPEERFESMTSLRDALAAARRVGGGGYSPVEVVAPRREDAGTGARVVAPRERAHGAEQRTKVVHGVELVLVRGGRFVMGSPEEEEGRDDDEGPQHEVELASFWLARTPVTNAQYREYMKANPGVQEPKHWGDRRFNQPQQPVVGVSWHEAKAYCAWAGLRLPTEAQWEYACRAGSRTRYCTGNTEEDLKKVGWYKGNSGGQLHAVRELEPNAWGLYDMHGNVYEWCEDAFGSYATSPRGGDGLRHEPAGDANRVMRGGFFGGGARDARSAFRDRLEPADRLSFVGFRPAQGHP